VRCSRGTYVRTLADDIGQALGVGAHLTALRRTASGSFTQLAAITLEELSLSRLDSLLQGRVISVKKALAGLLELHLTEAGCRRIRNGIAPTLHDLEPFIGQMPGSGRVKLLFAGELQAVADILHAEQASAYFGLKICRVFNLLSPLHAPV